MKRVFFAFLFVCCSISTAFAADSAAGKQWLAVQQLSDGRVVSAQAFADSLQVTAETVAVLDGTTGLSFDKNAAIAFVTQNRQSHSEALYWKILLKSLAAQSAVDEFRELSANQNRDGGFGSYQGYDSNPLDTAFAIKAFLLSSVPDTALISRALTYLLQQEQSSGAYQLDSSNPQSVYVTSIALTALNRLKFNFSIATEIDRATQFLTTSLNNTGLSLPAWQQALAIIAVRQATVDVLSYKDAADLLFNSQQSNGSWMDDAYTTALVLRSAEETDQVQLPASLSESSLSGRVVDDQSSIPVVGAQIFLQQTQDTTQTFTVSANGQGLFSLTAIPHGEYQIQVSASGYAIQNATMTLQAGSNLELGNVRLTALPDTGLIQGQISSAEDGAALAGVSISAAGNTVFTDANGFYQLVTAPGQVTLSVALDGYQSLQASATVVAGATINFSPSLSLSSSPAVLVTSVKGRILDFDTLQPISNVVISLNGNEVAQTDSNGLFSVADTPDGDVAIALSTDGYQTITYSATLVKNVINSLGDLTIKAVSTNAKTKAQGLVVDAVDGTPIEGAEVLISPTGISVFTGADGRYAIDNIDQTDFSIEINAIGYFGASSQVKAELGSIVNADAKLQRAASSGIEITGLTSSVGDSFAAYSKVPLIVSLKNTNDSLKKVRLYLKVINEAGDVVEQSPTIVVPMGGSLEDALLTLNAQSSIDSDVDWYVTNHSAGYYQLVVQAYSPEGQLLAERASRIQILPTQKIGGAAEFSPPIAQLADNTPIDISAMVANRGNVNLQNQTLTATVTLKNKGFGPERLDTSISDFVPPLEVNNATASAADSRGNFYYLNANGSELKKRSVDGSVQVVISGFKSRVWDIEIDQNDIIHLLTDNSVIKIDRQGNQSVLMLDINNARKLTLDPQGNYYLYSTVGLYFYTPKNGSVLLSQRGLSGAHTAVKLSNGSIIIASGNGDVFSYKDGKLSLYQHYAKTFIRLIAFDDDRVFGISNSNNAVYELIPDGSLSLIADGFTLITDLVQSGADIVVTDHGANQIVRISLDGTKTVLAHSTFTGMTAFVELAGELYGIRNHYEFVHIGTDRETQLIGKIPYADKLVVNESQGNLIFSSGSTLYALNVDGSYSILMNNVSPHRVLKVDVAGGVYTDSSAGYFPINQVSNGQSDSIIDKQFSNLWAYSKVPGQDAVLVLNSDGNVFRIRADFTYKSLGKLGFSSYGTNNLIALSESEFVVGDYYGKKLIKFNGNGTNEVIASLDFNPGYLYRADDGVIYVAPIHGNRIYSWTSASGIQLYKNLDAAIFYGFVVDDQGEVNYVRSDSYIYRSGAVEQRLVRPYSTPSNLYMDNGQIMVASYGHIQSVDSSGTLTTLIDSGAIANEGSLSAFPMSDGRLLVITRTGKVITYSADYSEWEVRQGLYGIRDFQVTSQGTYVLDNSGRIGLFSEKGKLAKLLYRAGSYQSFYVIDADNILLLGSTNVLKANLPSATGATILQGINSYGQYAIRQNGLLTVYDSGAEEVATVSFDGVEQERYFDIATPYLIAEGGDSNLYLMQNSKESYRFVYQLNRFGKLSKASTDYYYSPVSFRYIDNRFVLMQRTRIYTGDTIQDLQPSWACCGGGLDIYYDIVDLTDSGMTAISSYGVIHGSAAGQSYEKFYLSTVNDMAVASDDQLYVAASDRLLYLDALNRLNAFPFQLASLTSLSESPDGTLNLLSNGTNIYTLDMTSGQLSMLDNNPASVSYTNMLPWGNGYLLQGIASISKLTLAKSSEAISEGEVVFQQSADFAGAVTGSPALNLTFGQWTPKESGDYEVRIVSRNSSTSGELINQIHVGPLAQATVGTQQDEILPGTSTVNGAVVLTGADSSSITTINPDATSLAASSYTYGRAIAADSKGNIYAGDYSKIRIMTPDGELSDFVTGNLYIRNGMAVDDDDNIYAATSQGILKVTQQKEISFNSSIGAINAVTIDDDNVLYALTNGGVYKFTDRLTPTLITSSGLKQPRAIAVDAYGTIYVLNSGNKISKITQGGEVSDYYDGAIFEYEGVNLVADCSKNLLYAPLSEPSVGKTYGEEDILVQLMADTRQVRQVLDGRLYDRAMGDMDVLYYDRFGDRILVWTDEANGKIFSFPVICGGIDVELHATSRSDVNVGFADLLPDETLSANGQNEYIWHLKNVDVHGVTIPAAFTLNNMQEGESRPVLDSAFIRFNNSFDPDNPVDLPVTIPKISAVTRVSLSAQTDRTGYLPDTQVNIAVHFTNQSGGDLSGDIQYGIYDPQGGLVYQFPAESIVDQAPLQDRLLQTTWNTQSTLAGDYALKAEFLNTRGEKVEEVQYPFTVVSSEQVDFVAVTGKVSTDKTLYKKGETAFVSTRVMNKASNTILNDLVAQLELVDVNGTRIFSTSQTVGTLYPNGIQSNQVSVALSSVAAGQYKAILTVIDASTGQVQTTENYAFTVDQGGMNGTGLVATTQVSATHTNKGLPFNCQHNVTNIGTAAVAATEFRTFVANAANEELLDIQQQSLALAAGGNQQLSANYATQNLAFGGYVCVIQANFNNQWTTLSSAAVEVREDPVFSQLTASVQAANDEIYQGESASCMDSITFSTTDAVSDTNITLIKTLVRATDNQVIEESVQDEILAANNSLVTSRSYATEALELGDYRCELSAERNGYRKRLAQDAFTLVEPPIKVTATMENGSRGRLLVLTDQARQCTAMESVEYELNLANIFADIGDIQVEVYNSRNEKVDSESVDRRERDIDYHRPHHHGANLLVNVSADGVMHLTLADAVNKLDHDYHIEVESHKGWFHKESKVWELPTNCERGLLQGENFDGMQLVNVTRFNDPTDTTQAQDPYGPVEAPDLNAQNDFIQAQLQTQGWHYTLVHTADDFVREMHQGDYAAYLLLAERPHLPELAQKELREQVYSGKGLLVAGAHDERNQLLNSVLGAAANGQHKDANGLLDGSGAPLYRFPYADSVSFLRLNGATAEQRYSLLTGGSSDPEVDEDHGHHTTDHEHSSHKREDRDENEHEESSACGEDDEHHHHDEHHQYGQDTDHCDAGIAISHYPYGNGHAVLMGFDALAMATADQEGGQPELTQILLDSLDYLASAEPQALGWHEWPVDIRFINEAKAVNGTATLTLPDNITLAFAGDFEQSDQAQSNSEQSSGIWSMNFSLSDVDGDSAEYHNTLYLRMPNEDGQYSLNLAVDLQGVHGGSDHLDTSLVLTSTAVPTFDDMLEAASQVRNAHWYEPHLWPLFHTLWQAQSVMVGGEMEENQIEKVLALLIQATSIIEREQRQDMIELRHAIDQQIQIIGKQL